jgi:hypothetical protein
VSEPAAALGTFAVSGTAAEAESFRVATSLPPDGTQTLPLTFPMRWLVAPAVREALAALVPEPDLVLVHESQAFDYAAPLLTDHPYAMTLTARRKSDPAQLIVDGTIAARDGAAIGRLETILRLFSSRPVESGAASGADE